MLKFEPLERKSAAEINRHLNAFFNEAHRPVVSTSLEYAAEQNEQMELSNNSMAGNVRVSIPILPV